MKKWLIFAGVMVLAGLLFSAYALSVMQCQSSSLAVTANQAIVKCDKQ